MLSKLEKVGECRRRPLSEDSRLRPLVKK